MLCHGQHATLCRGSPGDLDAGVPQAPVAHAVRHQRPGRDHPFAFGLVVRVVVARRGDGRPAAGQHGAAVAGVGHPHLVAADERRNGGAPRPSLGSCCRQNP